VLFVVQISNEYINFAVSELTNLVGIKESIAPKTMLEPLHSGKIRDCISTMANYLGLPVSIILSVTNQSLNDKFENGANIFPKQTGQSVAARVYLPDRLPLYGSSALNGFPIRVKVKAECTKNPDTFVAVMAHELSHVVLHSLWHPQRNNEVYTDFTAMILGFSDIIQIGRKQMETKQHYSTTTTTTTTYGYLSDDSFAFAFNRIQQTLVQKRKLENDLRNEVFQKLSNYQKQISDFKEKIFELGKSIEYLDNHRNKKIAEKDVQKIVEMHRLSQTDSFEAIQKQNQAKIDQLTESTITWLRPTGHYTLQNANQLRTSLKNLDNSILDLEKDSESIVDKIELVKKYAGVLGRIEINRQLKK
jgi:hypothetical protein